MLKAKHRLSILEAAAAARLPQDDRITIAEWRQWYETGEQPRRWLGNAALQSWVQQALERRRRVEGTLVLYEDYEPCDR